MKQCFGYIRVSTAKQGRLSVSLPEQRDAILRYAQRNEINITSWFEERETAAKLGRPVFNRMLNLLRHGKAHGVVLHKIDRGARNLRDWADLAELTDVGLEIHFANESLDLHSRGGRLSADIQAVIAADYIRNLREECLKGFYGRLKQGIFPLQAPVGYLDKGGGKPKEPDPIHGPLVRKTFELYATGEYSLETLRKHITKLGLRNRRGGEVSETGLSILLNNPFYIGIIKLKKTQETFQGVHEPLISKSLFDRVRAVLSGRINVKAQKHDFIFRRLLRCQSCGYNLIGEYQKGHCYYRCHTTECPTTCVREEVAESEIRANLTLLRFDEEERAYFKNKLSEMQAEWPARQEAEKKRVELQLGQIEARLNRLTDAFLDGTIDKAIFDQRKASLLQEKGSAQEAASNLAHEKPGAENHISKYLELAASALLSYDSAFPHEKRDLLRSLTSNLEVVGKNVVVKLLFPFDEVANRNKFTYSAPQRDVPRTWDAILTILTTAGQRGQLPVLSWSGCRPGQNSALN